MAVYLLALLLGILAGLRSMAAPAAVSWAAYFGLLKLQGTALAVLGYALTPWILTALAIGELVVDLLPSTPSRKAPAGFTARLLSGGLCGAALGMSVGAWMGRGRGRRSRRRDWHARGLRAQAQSCRAFHKDRPAALIEDLGVIGGLLLVVFAVASIA